MFRTIAFSGALAVSTLLIGATATPAFAASGPAYRAIPAAAFVKADTVVANEVLWKCGTAGCVASKATSRAAIVCAQAAKEVGPLVSFSANGEEFDAAALSKCNAKAGTPSAVAQR